MNSNSLSPFHSQPQSDTRRIAPQSDLSSVRSIAVFKAHRLWNRPIPLVPTCHLYGVPRATGNTRIGVLELVRLTLLLFPPSLPIPSWRQ